MTDFNTKYLIPNATYRVTMTDPDFGSTETKTMTGADLKELSYAVGHLYDMTADIIETTETTETTETAPAAEPETETAETTETAQDVDTIDRIADTIEALPARSAWTRGVKAYAAELLDSLRDAATYAAENGEPSPLESRETVRVALLNGACDWKEYSYGGCSLIYNGDIAARCCNPSELRRTHGGEKRPNAREGWLDVQARALYQAGAVLMAAYDIAVREGARA